MKRLKVETFECPYVECLWPKCRMDMKTCINRPLCGHEIEAAKCRIVSRFAIKPKRKRRR